MVSGSARLTFRPSLPSASLPGRDFLSIIDRRPAVELVGGSHRKVSLAGQALCSLKGNQRGALSRPLVCYFFVLREASVCADVLAFWHCYHLKLFRFLFSLAPPPASCGHDDRPAGLSGVEARGASARVRWSMSQVLASQGPSKFFPSSPFGSWSSEVSPSTASVASVASIPSWRP